MKLIDYYKPVFIDGGKAGNLWLIPHSSAKDVSKSKVVCKCSECGHTTLKVFVKDYCTNCGARYEE